MWSDGFKKLAEQWIDKSLPSMEFVKLSLRDFPEEVDLFAACLEKLKEAHQ